MKFSVSYSQNFQLKAIAKSSEKDRIFEEINYVEFHLSKKDVFIEIDSIFNKLEWSGYLNIRLDTVFLTDSIYTAQYVLGDQTKNIKIYYPQNINFHAFDPKKVLQPFSSNITDHYFEIDFTEITNALQAIVDDHEKKGNSFVQVSLKNIHLEKEMAIADLLISESRSRTIDKVIIKGYENFPKNFIPYDLDLKLGSTFNREKLKTASIAINKLIFATEQKPPEVLFTNDSTIVYLYIKKKASNKFDGVIGFASKEEGSGLEFNGYLDFLFNNIFNSGETIALFWKNNGNDSQRFFLSADAPYIFNLPIIPKVDFELFRQDTTFNNISTDLYLSYIINNKSKITGALNTENSSSLLKDQSSDSGVQSFKNIFYGIDYSYQLANDDNLFKDKFTFSLSAFYGNRRSDEIRTSQTRFSLLTNYLYSINLKNHFFIQNQSALLNSDNFLNNELFRIGGVNTIRGFNEESIFTNAFTIFNLEYRYRPTETSYFYTISDFSYFENQLIEENSKIYSLGIGYAFFTKIGLLNISYALGKFDDSPFNFDDSKLHIKIISVF